MYHVNLHYDINVIAVVFNFYYYNIFCIIIIIKKSSKHFAEKILVRRVITNDLSLPTAPELFSRFLRY